MSEELISKEQALEEINNAFHKAALDIDELIPFPKSLQPAEMGAPEHVPMHGVIYPFLDLKSIPINAGLESKNKER